MAVNAGSMKVALVLLSLIGAAWGGRSTLEEPLEQGLEIDKAISQSEPWIQSLRRLFSAHGGSPGFGSGGGFEPQGAGFPGGYYVTPGTRPGATGPEYNTNYGGGPGPTPVSGGSGGGCRRGDRTQQGIIDCTNAMRANPSMSRCGRGMRPVGPLRADPRLMNAAQGHSVAQDRARRMSHTLGGSTMSGRIKQSGYQGRAYAENVAAGQRDSFDVVESWMCSAGHRKNMMSCNYGDIGVGVSCSSGRCYWTQDFGCSGGCTCQGGGSGPPVSGGSGGFPGGYSSPSYGDDDDQGGSGGYPSYTVGPGRPTSGAGGSPGYYTGHPGYYDSGPTSGGSGGPGLYTGRPTSAGSGVPHHPMGGSSSGGGGPWVYSTPTDISGDGFEIPGAGKGSGGYGYSHMKPSRPTFTSPASRPAMPEMPSMPSSAGSSDVPSSARSVVTAGMGKVTTDAHAMGYAQADGKGESGPDSAAAYASARAIG